MKKRELLERIEELERKVERLELNEHGHVYWWWWPYPLGPYQPVYPAPQYKIDWCGDTGTTTACNTGTWTPSSESIDWDSLAACQQGYD